MTGVREVDPVAVIAGVLLADGTPWHEVVRQMEACWGPVDHMSEAFPFDLTDYYLEEMGPHLTRRLVSFVQLRSPAALPELKHSAVELESRGCTAAGHRRLNIDVGYLDLHRVVLASTKQGPRKIYLRDGIWADMTLGFAHGHFHPFPWTFPDFAQGRYNPFLCEVRSSYKQHRRQGLAGNSTE